jgi:hypothetical protein
MIHGVQRKDFKKIRILLAAEGIFVPDMTHPKRCGFFTVHHHHQDDWKSPNGRMSEEKTWLLKIIAPHPQASYRARDYAGDLEEAWKKIEKIPGAEAFMGGSMGAAHTGPFNFHMARRSADDREKPIPLYPAAVIMFDVGIIVGAHKTATIANAIQGKLSKLLESPMEEHEFGMKDWGVFYHSKSNRMDHVWYIVYRVLIGRGTGGVVATALKG